MLRGMNHCQPSETRSGQSGAPEPGEQRDPGAGGRLQPRSGPRCAAWSAPLSPRLQPGCHQVGSPARTTTVATHVKELPTNFCISQSAGQKFVSTAVQRER